MKEIIVNLDLELEANSLNPSIAEDFNKRITDEGKKTVRDCVYGTQRHENYLAYLRMAWSNHYGVVISPDIIWHLILSEVGTHIKDNSDYYKSLFTTSENKIEITVPTADPQLIDLDLIIESLKKLVPIDINLFIPEFTTSTKSSSLAFMAAFADAMTPYYSYSMYLCGIPKIKILGEKSDWDKISLNIGALRGVLDKDDEIMNYVMDISVLISKIRSNYGSVDKSFLMDIFLLKECGSGHQSEVFGWIHNFFIKNPDIRYVQNYPTCISKVPYTLLDTGQKFELCHGLFSSAKEDGFLIPEFGFIINEIEEN